MQWPPVNGTADAGTLEFIDEFVSVDVQALQFQPDGKQVPGKDAVRFVSWQLDLLNLRKAFDVLLRDVFALLTHRFSAIQLMYADGRRDVGKVVLEPGRHDLVIPGSVS